MHPPLYRPHPKCEDVVQRLVKCHEENPWSKFWGACNDHKAALDICFRAEKREAQVANLEKARRSQARLQAKLEAKRQAAEASASE